LLIYFYSVGGRFGLPALPIMTVLGLTGVAACATRVARPLDERLARRLPRWTRWRPHAGTTAIVAACAALLLFAAADGRALQDWQQGAVGVTPSFQASPLEGFAGWANQRLPRDAVIMARYPWELRFYAPAGLKTVATPWTSEPRVILGIAWYYGVTHILADGARPELNSYLAAGHPGVVEVPGAPLPLYALDFSTIRNGEVVLPHQAADARTTFPPTNSPAS
jgi:hypothetical protein